LIQVDVLPHEVLFAVAHPGDLFDATQREPARGFRSPAGMFLHGGPRELMAAGCFRSERHQRE
jgi:hypothetical protein